MYCKKCGSRIPDNSKFCEVCGRPADGGGKKPMWPIAAAIVAAVVLILAVASVAIYFSYDQDTPAGSESGVSDAGGVQTETDIPVREEGTSQPSNAVRSLSLSLNGDKNESVLYLGEDKPTFRVDVEPEDAQAVLSFTSSAPKVAVVDGKGTVTPISEGSAVITVSEPGGVTGQFRVTVAEPVEEQPSPRPERQPAPEPEPEPEPYDYSDELLFPDYNRYLTEDDLYGLGYDTVNLILNEIYARNGYEFQKEKFRSYFGSMSWYNPVTGDQSKVYNSMGKIDKANVDFLVNYMADQGWTRN